MNRAATTGIAFVHSISTSVQRIAGTILASVPASVRIVFFDYRWLLLDYLKGSEWLDNFELETKKNYFTSVLAQLHDMAVHKNMFISSMIKNKTPNANASQVSQLDQMPASLQIGEITEDKGEIFN